MREVVRAESDAQEYSTGAESTGETEAGAVVVIDGIFAVAICLSMACLT
jgi:hypothetical protein